MRQEYIQKIIKLVKMTTSEKKLQRMYALIHSVFIR